MRGTRFGRRHNTVPNGWLFLLEWCPTRTQPKETPQGRLCVGLCPFVSPPGVFWASLLTQRVVFLHKDSRVLDKPVRDFHVYIHWRFVSWLKSLVLKGSHQWHETYIQMAVAFTGAGTPPLDRSSSSTSKTSSSLPESSISLPESSISNLSSSLLPQNPPVHKLSSVRNACHWQSEQFSNGKQRNGSVTHDCALRVQQSPLE